VIDDKKLIKKIIDVAVAKANKERKLVDYAKEKTQGEQRIAYIRIIDLDVDYWLGFDGEHIVKLDAEGYVKPTTTLTMTSDTFYSIVLGKITPTEAIYLGFVTIDGEFWMRDLALFEEGIRKFFAKIAREVSM